MLTVPDSVRQTDIFITREELILYDDWRKWDAMRLELLTLEPDCSGLYAHVCDLPNRYEFAHGPGILFLIDCSLFMTSAAACLLFHVDD